MVIPNSTKLGTHSNGIMQSMDKINSEKKHCVHISCVNHFAPQYAVSSYT